MGEKNSKWDIQQKKNIFFYSNYDFTACESHGNKFLGGLSTNPKKNPALVIRCAESTLLGEVRKDLLSARHF